jgi:hypothetical protein
MGGSQDPLLGDDRAATEERALKAQGDLPRMLLDVGRSAIGDPGVVDVIDIKAMRRSEVVPTEAGAHTLAIDRPRNKLYAFLPRSHRAAVFEDLA